MPTYEYGCTSCGNQWEEIQKISEPALTDCPKCKQATAQRLISGGNFILKGGGWYADLYSSSKPAAKSSDSTSTSSSDAKPSAPAKSESKPSTAPAPSTSSSGSSSGGSSGSGTT